MGLEKFAVGAWDAVGGLFGFTSAASAAKRNLPFIEEECTAKVYHNPQGNKTDAYKLALAICFGLVKRFDAAQWLSPPPGLVMLEYSPTENWVQATVRFKTSLVSSAFAGSLTSNVTAPLTVGPETIANIFGYTLGASKPLPLYANAAVYAGPRSDVVGGKWAFTGALIPGIPATNQAHSAPSLPFAGRTIITPDRTCRLPDLSMPAGSEPVGLSIDPRPAGDGRSRGVVQDTTPGAALVALVFNALSDPGSQRLMTFASTYPPPREANPLVNP